MELTLPDGTQIHYEYTPCSNDAAKGAPVVLLHGWGCRGTTMGLFARVASSQHDVYAMDFPGFGDSPEPSDTWGVEMYTAAVRQFIETLKLDTPILVGHSFGGRVCILYASQWPVVKVVLVDAAGIKPRRSLKYHVKVKSFKLAKAVLPALVGKQKAAKIIESWRGRSGSSDYNQATPRMRAILSRVVNEDLTDRLPLIPAPTLLLWGENDTATPLADARKMERLIPDAGLVVMEGCGHFSFVDNPGLTGAAFGSFINS